MPQKLGQNFLVNKDIARKIIKAADLTPEDFVLEIGPGKGILTEELAKYAGKVIAVEIDKFLVELLSNKFSNKENVEIVGGDILEVSLKNILGGFASKYKVVANLPYYITSPIIRLFLETENPPAEMILMIQKEVAERIVASPREIPAESRSAKRISRGRPGKMSILSVSVQYYADAQILFEVGKENFNPVPEVDSAVIKVVSHSSSPCLGRGTKGEGDKKFFRVVRAGFCAKRKTLANNLANSFHLDKKEVEEKITSTGLGKNVRAQELSVENWGKLAELF